MSFEDAHSCNLINHIWEGSPEDFRRDILDWCSQFTLPNKAVKAVGNIKRSCQTGPEIPFEYHLALERELQTSLETKLLEAIKCQNIMFLQMFQMN